MFSPLFVSELDNLAKALYQDKYFSFVEDVDAYIGKIYDFIETKIDYLISKNSPQNFQRYVRNIFGTKPIVKLIGIFFSIKKIIVFLLILFLITILRNFQN